MTHQVEFINKFLRQPSERRITEEEYAKVSKNPEKVDVYSLSWQVRVRKKLFDNKPFNRLK